MLNARNSRVVYKLIYHWRFNRFTSLRTKVQPQQSERRNPIPQQSSNSHCCRISERNAQQWNALQQLEIPGYLTTTMAIWEMRGISVMTESVAGLACARVTSAGDLSRRSLGLWPRPSPITGWACPQRRLETQRPKAFFSDRQGSTHLENRWPSPRI